MTAPAGSGREGPSIASPAGLLCGWPAGGLTKVTRYVAVGVRLTELVGEPVMQYVAGWRLQVGHSWLEDEGATVAELANRLGYPSEGAFARAFKGVAA